MKIQTPISVGELLDKITILELKTEFISEEQALKNVQHELAELEEVRSKLNIVENIQETLEKLRTVNRKLWRVEDQLREFEAQKRFDEEFVEKARSVYLLNDQRASLKYEINTLSGSALIEEKSYRKY